jgi:hypothetical protein
VLCSDDHSTEYDVLFSDDGRPICCLESGIVICFLPFIPDCLTCWRTEAVQLSYGGSDMCVFL